MLEKIMWFILIACNGDVYDESMGIMPGQSPNVPINYPFIVISGTNMLGMNE